jgi:metal-responsive CopG/Arc/MetJ family transcriptional regulator
MKRTTIMLEEELLYQLKQIARQQEKPFSSVVREALAVYVTEQQEQDWPENPLLAIVGLGESEEPMDLSNGGDEELLMAGLHPVYGWTLRDDDSS